MTAMRFLCELPPSLKWKLGRAATVLVYRRAFKSLGSGSTILKPKILRGVERISMGKDCAVHDGAWLAAEPGGNLAIGDGVYVGHNVHLHAIDDVVIGTGTMIADGVLINSGTHIPEDEMAVRGTGRISVGERCFIGQNVVILGGVSIGQGATIGAGAVVTRDVPAGATAVGVPARVISSISSALNNELISQRKNKETA